MSVYDTACSQQTACIVNAEQYMQSCPRVLLYQTVHCRHHNQGVHELGVS
jgi:hypothetical protein